MSREQYLKKNKLPKMKTKIIEIVIELNTAESKLLNWKHPECSVKRER